MNYLQKVLNNDENSLLMKRRTGDNKYTDKILFTFSQSSDSCELQMCSESQVFSVADFSTNFCNMYLMFCGSSDGCPYVEHDFEYKEVKVSPSIGAGTSKTACLPKVYQNLVNSIIKTIQPFV